MRVSVIVPALNHWPLTQACVATLLAATDAELLADVIVVDDGSTDGISADWAAAQRHFRPVLLPQNRGFSHACNQGASAARGDALLFLNNDAFVRPGSIATMLATLRAEPSIGVVGAKLLYADGTLQHAGLALLDGPVSRWWHVHRQLPGTLPDASIGRDLLAVTGAALMIGRPLFEALGGFDAGYMNGWEDVDLCLRAWSAGRRVRYEPRAVIEHLESATLGRTHDDRANEARFIDRWASALAAAPRYPLAEIPPLALAAFTRDRARAADKGALAHIARHWRAHFGARVSLTRPASRIDRARVELAAALAKRRPTLEVSWSNAALAAATGPLRVAFVAPLDAGEAQSVARAANIAAWWTPTPAGRDALVNAGAPADRVGVVRLGTGTFEALTRSAGPTVAACSDDIDVLHELARRAPHVRTLVLRNAATLDFGTVDIVVARRGGDRWGQLIPAALAHGCHVVASPPLDALVAQTTGVTLVDDSLLLDVLLERIADLPAIRTQSVDVQLSARRRLAASLATQHAAQVARALVHGTPSSALIEVDAALRARLRGATVVSRA